MKISTILVVMLFLSGCAGKVDYLRPATQFTTGSNTKIIDASKDAVWSASVPELGKQFFVINNLDKSSGLINVSYTGDPEKYVDCGRLVSYVKNARGERTYDFPLSKSNQQYETMEGGILYAFDRRLSLDGRVNLIFEEVGPNQTKVTANTRYVLNRQLATRSAANPNVFNESDSIAFNTGSSASFSHLSGQGTECAATGELEREILYTIKAAP